MREGVAIEEVAAAIGDAEADAAGVIVVHSGIDEFVGALTVDDGALAELGQARIGIDQPGIGRQPAAIGRGDHGGAPAEIVERHLGA